MITKIKKLFSSIRFLQLLTVLVIQILVVLNVINGDQGTQIANLISIFLGASVTVGTFDKRSETIAGSTTVTMPNTVSEVTATTKKSSGKQLVNKKK